MQVELNIAQWVEFSTGERVYCYVEAISYNPGDQTVEVRFRVLPEPEPVEPSLIEWPVHCQWPKDNA